MNNELLQYIYFLSKVKKVLFSLIIDNNVWKVKMKKSAE